MPSMQSVNFVVFDKSVLNEISSFMAAKGFRREQGGLLLGLRKKETIRVTGCTFPGVQDGRARFRFTRRDPKHQKLAYEAWKRTKRTCDWVGEWHSHPEDYPLPSGVDRSTWKRQCSERREAMNYLIIGMSENWVGLQTAPQESVRRISVHGETSCNALYC